MPSWPATLPQQFVGLSDKRKSAVSRSDVEQGPPIQRRRFTAAYREVEIPLIINGTQRQTFDTFFETTLKEGALSFEWEDPVTDATVDMRFIEPPEWQMTRGGTTETRIWRTTMKLEILP